MIKCSEPGNGEYFDEQLSYMDEVEAEIYYPDKEISTWLILDDKSFEIR